MNNTAIMISSNVKRLRKLNSLSQKQVCMTAGIPQGQYSLIENGKVVPAIPTLEKISKVFEVGLGEFFKSHDGEEEVNIPLLEKIKLLDQLDKDEKDALMKLIDMAVSKKRLKDNLSDLLSS